MRSDIVHVDLDAFYVSVERRRDTALCDRPVAVGSGGSRGVVLSCSYEARGAGVRNGMPSVRARRMCPQLVFVDPDFEAYRDASRGFRELLGGITPLVEPISLDEAFCDVTGAHRLFGDSHAIARHIRRTVREQLGLVCSVGGGPSKLVAKMASRACKPDGALVVDDVEGFLAPLAAAELWGVGEATLATLHRLGIRVIGDIAAAPDWLLRAELGEAQGAHLSALARGHDPSPVVVGTEAKSVGAEQTFDRDLVSADRLSAELLALSDRVASRLAAQGTSGRTVTVKMRLGTFATHTRSRTLQRPTSDVWTISGVARDALSSLHKPGQPVRLLGVSVSGLTTGAVPSQLTLDPAPAYEAAADALMRVRSRFGPEAVRLGRLVARPADEE